MQASGDDQTDQQPRLWEPDTSRLPSEDGSGVWVKHGEELGYAKYDKREEEWLAFHLGELVLAPVAKVERGILAGNQAAVSRVRSVHSTPLSRAEYPQQELTAAIMRASGLIPFLLWIGSGDHGKQSNFVATPDAEGNLYIEAIDFGYCFEWKVDGLNGVAILQELIDHCDAERVGAVLSAVEHLSDECILESCRKSGIASADEIAAKLISRKKSLRGWLAPLLG